jgi:Domain of unknown function (DUF4157)/Novel toxin 16
MAASMALARKRPGTALNRDCGMAPGTGRRFSALNTHPDPLFTSQQGHGIQFIRRCGDGPCSCEHEDGGAAVRPYRKTSGRAGEAVPQSVFNALRMPGRPLESSVNAEMSTRLRHDFRSVRIHTDMAAARSARDIGARAYAVGHHVVFGVNEYQPSTLPGRRLLAHELAHITQQGPTAPGSHLLLGSQYAAAEADAERAADTIVGSSAGGVASSHQWDSFIVRRQPAVTQDTEARPSAKDPGSSGSSRPSVAASATQNLAAPGSLPGAALRPPGDCTWAEHRMLQDEVDRACNRDTRCTQNDSCPALWEKITFNAECIRARAVINARCFRGGNIGHIIALTNAVGGMVRCWVVYNRECQKKPVPVPVPEKVPEPEKKPVIDKTFMDKMAAITGLTGTALVIYIILSEGSRLFPPRNLVPAPCPGGSHGYRPSNTRPPYRQELWRECVPR